MSWLSDPLASTEWTSTQEQTLLEPYTYIADVGGKEIRSKLIDAFDLWLKVSKSDLEVIRRVIRMLHNASLLVDDIEDNSELRRGIPVAHHIYGTPQTINTANYVYFLAMQELIKLEGSGREVIGLVTGHLYIIFLHTRAQLTPDELLNLHRGQGMDLYWRDSLTCPTEEEYVQMVLGKTGGLFRIAVKLMMARSSSDVDYVPLVNLISIYFQIRDDYMNLQSTEYADNKGFAEDLTEGKFSFPVVHGVRAEPSNRQVLNVLQKRTTSRALKEHTVTYLRNTTKSFEYTRKVLIELRGKVDDEISRLGGNPALEKIVQMLGLPEESS